MDLEDLDADDIMFLLTQSRVIPADVYGTLTQHGLTPYHSSRSKAVSDLESFLFWDMAEIAAFATGA
jgi:hypothetical protein